MGRVRRVWPPAGTDAAPYHIFLLSAKKGVTPRKCNAMGKRAFGTLACFGLLLAVADSIWAQNQSEGKKLYLTYCSSCHGDSGKGDGPAARSLPVKPADHTDGSVMNQLSDKFLRDIISKGGSAVGKSAMMPGWGGQFKENELRDIVVYVRSIAVPPYKAPGK